MNDEKLQQLIFETLGLVTQLHIYHLTTRSYAIHDALKEAYEDIQEDADKLAESYIGNNGDLEGFGEYEATFDTEFDGEILSEYLDSYREQVTECIDFTNDSKMISLQDILVDLQGDVDSLKYKLNLH